MRMVFPSVIIDDLDFCRSRVCPDEANPPLVVDPYAPLAFAVAAQSLKPVAGRRARVLQFTGGVQHVELAPRHTGGVLPPRLALAGCEEFFRRQRAICSNSSRNVNA